MNEYCPICAESLIPTTFDKDGLVLYAGIGCPDKHYSKVVGKGMLVEVVDGEHFSCHMQQPFEVKMEWQRIINGAVFRACRKYRAGKLTPAR